MKILLTYSDWLILERGEVRPEIGDKIQMPFMTGGGLYPCKVTKIEKLSKYTYIFRSDKIRCLLDNIYVEINYPIDYKTYKDSNV